LSCLWQDLQITLLLVSGVMLLWLSRALLGIQSGAWETLMKALQPAV
jgi:hypothetical protein